MKICHFFIPLYGLKTTFDMKNTILTLISLIIPSMLCAQNTELLKLQFEARADYMQEYQESGKINGNSGFKGKYLNIRMDGNITDGLSYSYRQRLNKPNSDATFFDATDWITATYTTGNWSISAGKQVVGIGGFEYDGAPIDLYFCSEFWNNIPCYQFGASLTYTSAEKADKYMIQFCESPFRRNSHNTENREMFAYNAMWCGSHGVFTSLYSVNMIEYLPGRFINYIALGNQFKLDQVTLTVDFMNRALSFRDLLGKDFSIMSEVAWQPAEWINIFARMSYDLNKSKEEGDWCVAPGTDILRVGGGIECYPIKNYRNFRLHLNGCHTIGSSAPAGVLKNNQTIVDAGITWKVDLLNIKRKNS